MDKFAKAVGAAQGGVTSAASVIAVAAIFLQFVPTSVAVPFWGYALMIFLALLFCVLFPALATYLAPANEQPKVGETVSATTPAKVVPADQATTAAPT